MSSEPSADGVCATSRLLPLKPEQVLATFADGTRLATRWGPDGFTNSFEVLEFKAHGRWKFVMHGQDGKSYANDNVILEAGPARVVIRHVSPPHFMLTVTLAEKDSQTMAHWHQAFDDPAFAASVWHIVAPANEQNLDRLHRALSAQAA